jgi:hypothetical protein
MSAKTELRIDFTGVDKTAGAVRSILGGVRGMALKAGAALAGAFTVGAIIQGGRKMISMLDDVAHASLKTGIAVIPLQKLDTVFKALDIDVAQAHNGIQRLEKNLATGEKGAFFESLGLDVQALKQMAPQDIFRQVGAAIATLPTESDRAAAAFQAFGRGGKEMLPLFRQGPEAFKQGLDDIGNMLPIFSAGAVDAGHEISDGFKSVSQAIMVDLANAFTSSAGAGEDSFGRIEIAIFKAYEYVKMVVKNWYDVFAWLFDSIATGWENLMAGNLFNEMSQTVEPLTDRIQQNMNEMNDAVNKFSVGVKAKEKFRTPLDTIAEAADYVIIKVKAARDAVSMMGKGAWGGTYAAIQAQYGGMMPAVAGARLSDPFGSGGNGKIGDKMIKLLTDIATNTKKTEENLDLEEF